VLRTIEDMYGLPHIGAAASATTITGAFYSQPRAWLGGDTNFDGTVNSGDFAVLASNFNGSNKSWTTGDFNGDGRVNALDFNALASGFGQTSAVPPTALGTLIPEPGCCAALLAVLVGRRCRRSSRDNSSSSGLGFEGGTSRRFVDRR
jgi:hypothetical protein